MPRLRMFSGPNGSGKSTMKEVIPEALLGVYINPDDIEKVWRQSGCIDFFVFKVWSMLKRYWTFSDSPPFWRTQGSPRRFLSFVLTRAGYV